MRPRIIIRGNLIFKNGVPSTRKASMRPRIIIRGNRMRRMDQSLNTPGFNEAADHHPRKLVNIPDTQLAR